MHSFIISNNEHKLEIFSCGTLWTFMELPETKDGQTFVFIDVCIVNSVWYRRFIHLQVNDILLIHEYFKLFGITFFPYTSIGLEMNP